MIRRTIVALSLATFAVAGAASAQENATFTLKSGEKVSGQLVDLSGVGFTVKVGDQDRRIAPNDVAVIDFTGGGANQGDYDRLGSGQFAVLKDGQIVTGQLTDIGGTQPLRLTFSSNGANRDVESNSVARIVLARPADAPAATAATGGATPLPTTGTTGTVAGTQTLTVSAKQQWSPTGIAVRRGETLVISGNGEIRFGAGTASANGSTEQNQANPIPSVATGALIGRIGNGTPFVVGAQTTVLSPAAGELFLGVNDSQVQDNDGTFQVQVQRQAVRRR